MRGSEGFLRDEIHGRSGRMGSESEDGQRGLQGLLGKVLPQMSEGGMAFVIVLFDSVILEYFVW